MRALFITLSLCIASMAYGQSPEKPKEKPRQAKKAATKDERGTKQSPLIVDVLPAPDADQIAKERREQERTKLSYDRLIAYGTAALAGVTALLWLFTALMWTTTRRMAKDARNTSDRQAAETATALKISEETAKAARDSADAAVASAAPFLVPTVSSFDLYPTDRDVGDEYVHRPAFVLTLENVGRTPALMRWAGAKLLLIEGGRMPPEPPAIKAMKIERSDTIAPGGSTHIKKFGFEREITATEIRRLRAPAIKGKPALRFHVFGFAIYDDVFGVRCTQRFCIKLRHEGNFHRQRSGEPYNYVERKKIPQDQPEEMAPEGDGAG